VNAPDKAEPRVFVQSGLADLLAVVEALDAAGGALPEGAAILELGCGVGRLLRHLPDGRGRVAATDINEDCLAWCRANLPGIECHLHGSTPPIGTLAGEAFDLIYANSVFTHIPLERQHAWLTEARRLLRPGGWLVATVLGVTHADLLLDPTARALLASRGELEVHPEQTADASDGSPTAFGAVFQTRKQQEAAFGAVFEECTVRERPGSQDIIVSRRAVANANDAPSAV
jgi:SAM-dependent methyltransferase